MRLIFIIIKIKRRGDEPGWQRGRYASRGQVDRTTWRWHCRGSCSSSYTQVHQDLLLRDFVIGIKGVVAQSAFKIEFSELHIFFLFNSLRITFERI